MAEITDFRQEVRKFLLLIKDKGTNATAINNYCYDIYFCRNVFNILWDDIPVSLVKAMKQAAAENNLACQHHDAGIIILFMIVI